MKLIVVAVLLLSISISFKIADKGNKIAIATDIKLNISYTVDKNASVPAHFADTLKKAEDMLATVFASKDFKEELYKLSYNDSAYSKSKKGCFDVIYDAKTGRISGEAVYNNLMANKNIELAITIKNNGDNRGTMGTSNACVNKITTYDYWLVGNGEIAIRLARHIAHEYTHIRGYRHDNKVPVAFKWGHKITEDPAYGVGSLVGTILNRWNKQGILKS